MIVPVSTKHCDEMTFKGFEWWWAWFCPNQISRVGSLENIWLTLTSLLVPKNFGSPLKKTTEQKWTEKHSLHARNTLEPNISSRVFSHPEKNVSVSHNWSYNLNKGFDVQHQKRQTEYIPIHAFCDTWRIHKQVYMNMLKAVLRNPESYIYIFVKMIWGNLLCLCLCDCNEQSMQFSLSCPISGNKLRSCWSPTNVQWQKPTKWSFIEKPWKKITREKCTGSILGDSRLIRKTNTM